MLDTIQKLLKQKNILFHKNSGITVCKVKDLEEGIGLGEELLYAITDQKTVLYLAGGGMKALYEKLAKEEKITPGAVGLIDERYGKPLHDNSNEKMIKYTGFLRYLHMRDIPFYSVLHADAPREELSEDYDERVRKLHAIFPKSIGIIGIGPDGHISSIIPNRPDFTNPWFDQDHKHLLVSDFNDPNSAYKERIGMTFMGLSMLDVNVILAFGSAKQNALNEMFKDGSEEEIPARFFKRPEIAEKTILITDQAI